MKHPGRTITLYPYYVALVNAHFWMPVFFLYFLEHMSLASVLRLEAIYYFTVVLLEAPSGYFSDRFGRRPTLLIATAALVAAYMTFYIGGGFAVFAVAQALLAVGLAFNSGTDTSLHYDSLASLGREAEFATREAGVARNSILVSGLAAIVGGAAGLAGLRYAYLLSAMGAIAALCVVLSMREPVSHQKVLAPMGPGRQLSTCARLLHQPVLAWTFAFFVLMTILNHVPYEFYQPYIGLALEGRLPLGDGTSLGTGLHVGFAMVIAAWFAGRSVRIRDRIGLAGVLLTATALQTLIILIMGLLLHPLVILLVLLRSVPRALMTAPLNAAIAPRVDRAQRATFLSIQSLAGRLAFSGFLVILSWLPGSETGDRWQSMSNQLLLAGMIGALGLIVLAISSRRMLRGTAVHP